jgi:hypothetical protein
VTAEFLRGFFTAVVVEGIIWTIFWIARRLAREPRERCALCDSPNLDVTGRSMYPVEDLRACPDCGETVPAKHAARGMLELGQYLALREAELEEQRRRGVACAIENGMSQEDAESFVDQMQRGGLQ